MSTNLMSCEDLNLSADYDAAAFIETTGIRERRYSNDFTTSDLCYAAAEKLIADLGWDKSEIGILVFVSQNADYILPATACILQSRLGLSKECYAEDIALGCSGWVYGLSTISGLMSAGTVKKALLLAGDAKRRAEYDLDTLMGFWLSGITTNIAAFIFTFMIAFLYLYAWCQQLIGCYAFKTLHLESVAAYASTTEE